MSILDSANEHLQTCLQKNAKNVFNSLDNTFKSNTEYISGYKQDNMAVFYKQIQRMTDKQSKPEKLNLRLTWDTLLTLQIFDILDINIKDFLRDISLEKELSHEDFDCNETQRKLNEIMIHLGLDCGADNTKKKNHSKEDIASFLFLSSKRYNSFINSSIPHYSQMSITDFEDKLAESGLEYITSTKYIRALNQLTQFDSIEYYTKDLLIYSKLIFIFVYLINTLVVKECQKEKKRSNFNPFVFEAPYELREIVTFFYDFISVLGKSISKIQKIESPGLKEILQEQSKKTKLMFSKLLINLFPNLFQTTFDILKPNPLGCENCFFNTKSIQEGIIIYCISPTDTNLDAIKQFSTNLREITDTILSEIIYVETKDKILTPLQMDAVEFVFRTWEKEKIYEHRPVPLVSLEMGSGKTWVGCKVIKETLMKNKNITSYTLIVCSANTIDSWANTLHDFGLFEKEKLQAKSIRKEVYNTFSNNKDTIYIISHDCLIKDIDNFHTNPPSLLILDEFHLFTTSEFILDRYIEMAKLNNKVDYIVGLSGTPTQNDSDDFIKNFVFFQGKDYLTKIISTKKWNISDEIRKDIMKTLSEKQLYFFGRDKDLDNLLVTEKIIPLLIPEKLKQGIEKIRKSKKNIQEVFQFLECPEKYKKDPCYEFVDDEQINMKFDFVERICKNVAEDEKIIVFSNYIDPLKELHERLKKQQKISYLYTSETGSNENIEDKLSGWFSKNAIILTTLKKSGIGLNLQEANTMIFLDLWWNPMSLIQGEYRIIRKKQTKPVKIYIPLYVEMINKNNSNFYYPQFIKEEKDRLTMIQNKLNDYNSTVSRINCVNKETTSRNFANDILGIVIKDINRSVFSKKKSSLKDIIENSENQSFDSIKNFESQPFQDNGDHLSALPFRTGNIDC